MKNKIATPIPIIDTIEAIDETISLTNSPEFAKIDLRIALDFLKQYDGNQATFDAYRREIERLLQWAWLIIKKSILDLKRQDVQEYIEFCIDPPRSWIGTIRCKRFIERGGIRIPNPKWRPFVATVSKQEYKAGNKPDKTKYQLSQKAIREIFTILSSFYNYLIQEDKTSSNPIALIKQKSKYLQKRQSQVPVMRLTEIQWKTCFETVKMMAEQHPEKHERTLFIISILYLLYLRISELVASNRWIPMMKHFYRHSDDSWWFKVVGKGNKLREIAVSDCMLSALKRYREKLNLSPLPSPNEQNVLLPKEKGGGAITNSRHIRRLVQNCFDLTIQMLREKKLFSEADAMESATVHWLRHTGISDDINKRGRPMAHVRDDAGHSSINTTDRYNDIELKERHLSAKGKKLTL